MNRLLYVVNARMPTEKAHGHQISKMCEAFACLGITVELWIPERKNTIKQDLFSFYDVQRNFNVVTVEGFDFFRLRRFIGRFSFLLQNMVFALRAFRKVSDRRSIIYTRNPEVAWIFGRRGYTTVYECHDWFGKSRKLSLFFLKRCSAIITTNRFIREEFIKNGVPAQKLVVAPNGVDVKTFDIAFEQEEAMRRLDVDHATKDRLSSKTILLYTGSFRTMGVDKGIEEILRALRQIEDNSVVLVAVGGGADDIVYYTRKAKEIGIGERAFFFGRCGHEQLALWQKAATILLMPFPRKAHYERFMTPLKMFEYMASKRPIIASNLPSIREILNDHNAFFCVAGDSADLAHKIRFVIENKVCADKTAAVAWADVRAYTWQTRVARILPFIRGIQT